jgi:hypothetical protein
VGSARAGSRATHGVAALAALVVLAASASAGLKEKSSSVELGASEAGSATAQCKRGSEAVAGGFELPPDFSAAFDAVRAGKRKWTAEGRTGSTPGSLTAFVYCDRSEPGLKKKSIDVSFDPETTTPSSTAKCKRGSEAVSGGFSSESEFRPQAVASRRDGKRRWTASGINPASEGTFTAFAYCDKSEPGLKTKSATVAIGGFQSGTATTKCKRKTQLVSGGFSSPEGMTAGFPGPAVIVTESRREGKRSWTVSGIAGSGGGSLTVYAYCQKKK